jgi:hypothetical protein
MHRAAALLLLLACDDPTRPAPAGSGEEAGAIPPAPEEAVAVSDEEDAPAEPSTPPRFSDDVDATVDDDDGSTYVGDLSDSFGPAFCSLGYSRIEGDLHIHDWAECGPDATVPITRIFDLACLTEATGNV